MGKWSYLIQGSKYDRTIIPIFKASAGGRLIPLLKTLVSNVCVNNCLYCAFRRDRGTLRGRWDLEKLTRISYDLWRKSIINGVFLSSSIDGDPDDVLMREVEVAERLRVMGFTGYIHLRIMPGSSFDNIFRAATVSDRIGVNIEAPEESQFDEICPDKGSFTNDILKRLEWCRVAYEYLDKSRRKLSEGYGLARSGLDTQMIVGLGENDLEIIVRTYELIRNYKVTRVYYSPFEPIPDTPLENHPYCPRTREISLYQMFYLIRDYGFTIEDFKHIVSDEGFLPSGNIKEIYAEKRRDLFPVNINDAGYHELLKIPGIGPRTARKIISKRERNGEFRNAFDLARIMGFNNLRKAAKFLEFKEDLKYYNSS